MSSSSKDPSWLAEPAIAGFQQRVQITGATYEGRSPYQRIEVYDTVPFGRTLVLEGAVQTTVEDEYVYHEMLVHPVMFGHGSARDVLVIGGADGGTLRRVLDHPVRRAVMVEIDREVVDVCARYMPEIAGEAFGDRRAELSIADGIRYVAETQSSFDVVMVDSTDPVGVAEGLFGLDFYRDVHRVLKANGYLVTQSGSPVLMQRELRHAAANLRLVFPFVSCYLANVPSYPGSLWSFLIAGKQPGVIEVFNAAAGAQARAVVGRRFAASSLVTHYYTPEIHFGSFALPRFIGDGIAPGSDA